MKSLCQANVTVFQLNVKFHFCPIFCAILPFYQQFRCKIYVWRWCGPNVIFFLVISIALSFQIKKSNSKTFVHVGFCSSKVFATFWDFSAGIEFYTQSVSKKKRLRLLIFAQTILLHSYIMEITTLIYIWLQLSHNGSSKLLKIFIKSISLAILTYLCGFFKKKKNEIFIFS